MKITNTIVLITSKSFNLYLLDKEFDTGYETPRYIKRFYKNLGRNYKIVKFKRLKNT